MIVSITALHHMQLDDALRVLAAALRPGIRKHSAMPVVGNPPLTTSQVAEMASAVLPGARVRRLLFWRYLLIWRKPLANPEP